MEEEKERGKDEDKKHHYSCGCGQFQAWLTKSEARKMRLPMDILLAVLSLIIIFGTIVNATATTESTIGLIILSTYEPRSPLPKGGG